MAPPRKLKVEGTNFHASFYEKEVQRILEPLRTPAGLSEFQNQSPLFSVSDISDLETFVSFLRRANGGPVAFTVSDIPNYLFSDLVGDTTRPVSVFLWSKLSKSSRTLLVAQLKEVGYRNQVVPELVQDLNRVINGPLLFEKKLFYGVKLARDTRKLLSRICTKEELVRLNRMLIEDSYPRGSFETVRPSAQAAWIWNRLSESTKELIHGEPCNDHNRLRAALVGDLNLIISSGPIFAKGKFAGITLRILKDEQLKKKLKKSKDDRILNRIVLESVFPQVLNINPYLRLDQSDLDQFLTFSLALFDVVLAFIEYPGDEANCRGFGVAWQQQPKIAAKLLTAITKYEMQPKEKWTKDRAIIRYCPDGGNTLPNWRSVTELIRDIMKGAFNVDMRIEENGLRQRVSDINSARRKILKKWKANTDARERMKRNGIPEPWFLSD